MPKRVTSGAVHLRGLAPGRHSSEKTLQQWRHCADLTGPGIEPHTSRTDSVRLTTELTGRFILQLMIQTKNSGSCKQP